MEGGRQLSIPLKSTGLSRAFAEVKYQCTLVLRNIK